MGHTCHFGLHGCHVYMYLLLWNGCCNQEKNVRVIVDDAQTTTLNTFQYQ